jgi:hypothetical protein
LCFEKLKISLTKSTKIHAKKEELFAIDVRIFENKSKHHGENFLKVESKLKTNMDRYQQVIIFELASTIL